MWLSRVEEVEEGEGPAAYLDDEKEGYAETEGGLFSHGRGLYVLEWGGVRGFVGERSVMFVAWYRVS